jgi:hypothetical protein
LSFYFLLGSRYALIISFKNNNNNKKRKKNIFRVFFLWNYIFSKKACKKPRPRAFLVTKRCPVCAFEWRWKKRVDSELRAQSAGDVSIYRRGRDKCCSRVEFLLSISSSLFLKKIFIIYFQFQHFAPHTYKGRKDRPLL